MYSGRTGNKSEGNNCTQEEQEIKVLGRTGKQGTEQGIKVLGAIERRENREQKCRELLYAGRIRNKSAGSSCTLGEQG